ncbi:MAG TPA: hypothetical protein K8V90_09015 [Romboutsia timonensis]|uniref:Uncharacterized protein n=1 Tax=Romboutsia timonensis TaxID=1776391 RepID=A0A921T071_9FIRM|nr:hypothetical protein [Romboutsia timonensis]
MNDEIIEIDETQENIFQTEKIETNLQEVNSSINKLLEFFQTDKQEKQEKEKQEQKIQEQEQQKIKEEQEKKEEEFLQNIQTIADNTNSEISTQLLNDVSTLMQVNIITSGLLIGIVCISLFAKFFKK